MIVGRFRDFLDYNISPLLSLIEVIAAPCDYICACDASADEEAKQKALASKTSWATLKES